MGLGCELFDSVAVMAHERVALMVVETASGGDFPAGSKLQVLERLVVRTSPEPLER